MHFFSQSRINNYQVLIIIKWFIESIPALVGQLYLVTLPALPGRAPGRHRRSPVTCSWGRRFPIEPVGSTWAPLASTTRKRSRVVPADHRSPAAGAAGSPSSRSAVPGRRWPALPGRAPGRHRRSPVTCSWGRRFPI